MTTFDLGPTRALRPDEREDAPVPGRVDLFWKAHEEARNASNFDAHLVNYSNAFDAIEDRVRKATGEELANPFRSAGPVESVETLSTFSREAVDGSMLVSKWRERLQELQAKHPDKMDWSGIADEPGRVAFETMKRVREESNAMQERLGLISPSDVPGVGKIPVVGPFLGAVPAMAYNMATAPSYTAMQLAGGFYGQMKSPADAAVNLISFGVGGTAKSLLKNAALNAASNMAGQAILSAPKQASYRSAGLPYGLDVWAEEVAAAGGAGFALDMGIRAPVRAAVNRFGRDTAPGSPFSRNTERGGFLLDAANDATPRPTPRETVTIDPETVKRAEAGDIAASREIIERTGAIQDPTIRGVLDHVEGGGRLSDEAIQVLDAMGVARADGMRALADAMQGRVPRMPDVVRDAPEPLRPERGAELSGEIDDRLRLLPQHVAQAVADGLEAGVPRIVRAVEDAIGGPPERFAEAVTTVLDPRTLAEIGMHAGRAGPVEMAQAIRSYPDLVDRSMPETPRIEMARDIARLSDEAYAKAVDGSVPPDVAAMVSREVPAEYQARAMADLDAARPRTMAEAMDLVRALTPPERPDVPAQPRMTEEAGAVQQRKVEALRGAAGQAYEAAVAPIRRRDAIEAEIETKRGQLAEMEREARRQQETADLVVRESSSGQVEGAQADPQVKLAEARQELDGLERELAELHREIDPSPTGEALYRVAMRALDMRRMSDIVDAINEAVAIGRRMTPAGTRIDVLPDQSMVSRAANGDRYQLDATSDTLTGHIQLAVSAMDPAAKMGHEAVHTLVTLGHLSPDEVSALASLAREAGTFKDEAKYRAAYEGRTGLDRILQEEAAASYIEARIKGAVDGPENTVIERIRQLIERIKQVLAGKGFKSREDVVQAVMSGEAARRDARADWARNAVAEGRQAMRDSAERGVDLPDGTRVNGVPLFAIRAFHGSPHDFDRFDINRIGTGEGAQAYGHGLYFAENEGVARSYRDALRVGVDYQGRGYPGGTSQPAAKQVADRINDQSTDPAQAIQQTYDEFMAAANSARAASGAGPAGQMNLRRAEQYEQMAEQIKQLNPSDFGYKPGRMYEVNINASPDDFLDWDKPLSQQSEKVKGTAAASVPVWDVAIPDGRTFGGNWTRADAEKIANEGAGRTVTLKNDMTGEQLVKRLAADPARTAQTLREAGIPGIRYLDQGSRGAGEGSRNYVVFDDAMIEIIAKDGVPTSGDKMFALAARVGATRIEDVGESDPHPGRVLAYHGTDAPIFDRFSIDQTSLRNFGIHFGGADLADLYTSPSKRVTTSRVIPAVLDLRNVVTIPDMDRWSATSIANAVEAEFPFAAGLAAEIASVVDDAGSVTATDVLRQRLTDIGVHGLRYWNAGAVPGWAYIVWEKGRVISPTSGDELFSIRDRLSRMFGAGSSDTPPTARVAEKMAEPMFYLVAEGETPSYTGLLSRMRSQGLTSRRPAAMDVPVSAIRPLQPPDDIEPDKLARYVASPPPRDVNIAEETGVSLYRDGDVYYTVDGHHRVEAARQRGDTTIAARVREIVPKEGNMFSIRDADTPLDMSPEAREPRGLAEGETTTSLLDRLSSMRTPLARKQRARELGFDTSRVFYHGSQSKSIDAFDLGRAETGWRGKAVHVTLDPKEAELYGSDGRDYPGAIYPLYLRISNTADYGKTVLDASDLTADQRRRFDDYWGRPDIELTPENVAAATSSDAVIEILKTKGFDSARVGRTHFMVFDPSNIRSVNAEFDPAKADSPNLMFSVSQEPDLRADMAFVDRMNRIAELIPACRG